VYTHILFDLDGTLTDPATGVLNSLRYALQQFGFEEEDDGVLTRFIGPPLAESFREIYSFSDQQVVEAIRHYRDYYSRVGLYENVVYPGIPEMLAALCTQGKRLYVATTKMTAFAEIVLKHFSLDRYFLRVIGGHPDGTRTAKNEIIAEILTGIPQPHKSNTVMVGDRKYDIIGARAHNLDTVAVTYGYGSADELAAENPLATVESVQALRHLLTEC
jgi:phosphoglycolate phosphatase